jgi:hypothetical protein
VVPHVDDAEGPPWPAGDGEGEGDIGREGEGDGGVDVGGEGGGEGEGEASEGEGEASEGEGAVGGEGEGEGEGDGDHEGHGTAALGDGTWDPSVGELDCATSWGQGGEGLSPCDTTRDDYVVVHKSARNLALCHAGAVVENFRTGLGFSPVGDKMQQGDGRTPEGVFYVPRLVPGSDYHAALLISYPDVEAADRAVAAGVLDPVTRVFIRAAQNACREPPQETAAGGLIEIHGGGGYTDWTAGCMALANDDVDRVYAALDVGDSVIVLP